MPRTKRMWVRPQLVILGRGTSQESVLSHCKVTRSSGPGNYGGLGEPCKENGTCSLSEIS